MKSQPKVRKLGAPEPLVKNKKRKMTMADNKDTLRYLRGQCGEMDREKGHKKSHLDHGLGKTEMVNRGKKALKKAK